MSSRESNDNSSNSGVSYAGGVASSKGTKLSQRSDGSLLKASGAFNGHAVEIWADNTVWDTVSNVALFPGRDYNPGDLHRK
jgi:hypothetical protein